MSNVAIVSQEDYDLTRVKQKLENVLSLADMMNKLKGKQVLLKPNCTNVYEIDESKTTHPVVVEALAQLLMDNGCGVKIGESSSVNIDTIAAYETTGIKDVAERLGIELIDFKRSKYVECSVNRNGSVERMLLSSIMLPEEIIEAEVVISMPKMKTNYPTTISCSMKNMKGVLRDKDKRNFHLIGLSQAVAELSCYLDKTMVVVDGIIGSELNYPKKGGVVIASDNMICCDSVCSRVMGINPYEIEHIRIANEREGYLRDTVVLGAIENLRNNEKWRTVPGLSAMGEGYGIEIKDGKPCSSCVGALYNGLLKLDDVAPVICVLGCALDSASETKLSGLDDDVVLIGNCTRRYKSECNGNMVFVEGCPPRSSTIVDGIKKSAINIIKTH